MSKYGWLNVACVWGTYGWPDGAIGRGLGISGRGGRIRAGSRTWSTRGALLSLWGQVGAPRQQCGLPWALLSGAQVPGLVLKLLGCRDSMTRSGTASWGAPGCMWDSSGARLRQSRGASHPSHLPELSGVWWEVGGSSCVRGRGGGRNWTARDERAGAAAWQ